MINGGGSQGVTFKHANIKLLANGPLTNLHLLETRNSELNHLPLDEASLVGTDQMVGIHHRS